MSDLFVLQKLLLGMRRLVFVVATEIVDMLSSLFFLNAILGSLVSDLEVLEVPRRDLVGEQDIEVGE